MAYRNLLNRATHCLWIRRHEAGKFFPDTCLFYSLPQAQPSLLHYEKLSKEPAKCVTPARKKKKKAIANGSMKKSASMPFFGQSRRRWRAQRQNEGSFQASLAKCSCRIRQARRCKWNKLPVWEALNAPVHHFGVCFTFGASLPFLLSSLTTTSGISLQPFLSRGTAALAEN